MVSATTSPSKVAAAALDPGSGSRGVYAGAKAGGVAAAALDDSATTTTNFPVRCRGDASDDSAGGVKSDENGGGRGDADVDASEAG